MPRRAPAPSPDLLGQEFQELQHLPVPQPHKQREHWEDPLTPMVGANPHEEVKPKRRKKNVQGEEIISPEVTRERKRLGQRYDRYLDCVIKYNGDRCAALCEIFDLEIDEAMERQDELHELVLQGVGNSSVADLLKKQDLGKATRIALLKRHAYSPVPAASLKAIDMLSEMDSDNHDQAGRYESYLAIALGEG